ncbi:agamous-like MADS-box protein AGL80 [Nicotiana tabacum]|uniref:Agamous-like MADS-box protein AGL80 n=1 Tax=Nicotiana tabacum TaxID=4097 RepID=A0AC58T5B5_TOBAC
MTKKGLRNIQNLSESKKKKKAILDKRTTALCKRAEALSILCMIEVGLIIYSPVETNSFVWPSLTHAADIVTNYLMFTEVQRENKLVRHDVYLQEKVNDMEKSVRSKIEQMAEKMEMKTLFNQLVKGRNINELDVRQMKGLLKLFDEKRARLEERKKQLNEQLVDENVASPSSAIGLGESEGNPNDDGENNDGP